MILSEEIDKLTTNWKPVLKECLKELPHLDTSVSHEIEFYDGVTHIYPPRDKLFSCFNAFNIDELKVVIIGQDPYHQPGQANGLCFSVESGIKHPPSLKNIFKEVHSDINGSDTQFNIDEWNTDLSRWASQGVLLLNNTLTVIHGRPNSHLKHWLGFTKYIVKYITENCNDVVFLLWGKNAQSVKKYIEKKDLNKHYFLESHHPSPLSANKGGWFGTKHFSKTNTILKTLGKTEIDWN